MKRDKILYWVFTSLIAFGFLMSSFIYLTKDPKITGGFQFLGYPQYLIPFLGIAKLLGALAIIQPWSKTVKEWAYAGITFTILGATWTHISTNTPVTQPLLFLAVTLLSYFFYQRVKTKQSVTNNNTQKSSNHLKGAIVLD